MPDLIYDRAAIQGPKTRQTARLLATVSVAAGRNPRNFEHGFGSYYEVYLDSGDVQVRRSYWATPPFAYTVPATSSGDATYPWLYALPRTRLVLLFTKAAADSYLATSDDEGLTWEAPVAVITGGIYPFGAVDPFDGTELVAAFITATGKIHGRRRQVGELAYGAEFVFKDDGGTDLLFESDTFAFHVGAEGPGRWVMHCHIQGEGATATFWSADAGATWTRIS